MITHYTYTNSSGKSISFGEGERYSIIEITGTSGVTAEISRNAAPNADGTVVSNIRIEERPITILAEAEDHSLMDHVLTVFGPKKDGVLYAGSTFINCNVDQILPSRKLFGRTFFVSMIATYPYFSGNELITKQIISWSNNWTFPFMLPGERTFIFGARDDSGSVEVVNEGHVECPITLTIRFTGTVINPLIKIRETGQFMLFNATFLAGDMVEVDTFHKRKSVRLNGSRNFSILGDGSEFFWLPQGLSTVEYSADSGSMSMEVDISYRNYYLSEVE